MALVVRDQLAARDRGAAAVDFVLVGSLVIALFLGVVQLGLAQHVRATTINAASEGARHGARADRGPADAVARTQNLITDGVSGRYADDVQARLTTIEGLEVVEVTVRMPLPIIGLIGPSGTVEVTAHALSEAS